MKSKASAVWQGGLKDGKGTISADSGVLSNVPYNFSMRFEGAKGTTPEELIAAAHAGCFAMALSAQLGEASITAKNIASTATVTLEKTDGGFAVTSSHLTVKIQAPGANRTAVETAANNAKAGCPISKLLNTKITLDATYEL
ncbi:MAG TPA: OsmC family protein [Terriglobia bacterium]|nr:OsmC family protein [Terriglobia bacterium]